MSAIHATAVAPKTIEWSEGLSNAWSSVANFVPKLLVFLVVLVIGIIVAKAVAKFVGIVLQKVGFARLLATGELGSLVNRTGVKPLDLITKLIYYFILLIALQLALSAFGPTNPVSAIVNDIVAWLPKAVVAIVIVVIAVAVAGAVKDLLRGALGGLSYGDLVTKIVGAAIVALGVIAALNQVGIGTTVTLPVLIAVLATIGGILVVGVGGGLIAPMRGRWEEWLSSLAESTAAAKTGPGGSRSQARGEGPSGPPSSQY